MVSVIADASASKVVVEERDYPPALRPSVNVQSLLKVFSEAEALVHVHNIHVLRIIVLVCNNRIITTQVVKQKLHK